MKLTCIRNGKQMVLNDPLDLDYIEYDVVRDFLKALEPLETNPNAKVELDLTEPFIPKYNLINCSPVFTEKFNQFVNRKRFA